MKFIAVWVLSSLSVVAFGADLGPEGNPDTNFFRRAAQGGISEVDAGTLAQRQATTPAVKQLAAMLVKDHNAALATLRSLAAEKEVDLPINAGADQAAKLAALQGLTGTAFDRSYIGWQIGAHQDAIALFKQESTEGDDVEARQFALYALPTLQAHLKLLFAIVIPPDVPAPAAVPATGTAPGVVPAPPAAPAAPGMSSGSAPPPPPPAPGSTAP